MVSEVVSRLMLFILEAVNIWSLCNSTMLWRFLWPRRKVDRTVMAIFAVNAAIGLHALSWCLILLTATLWPQATPSDSAAPTWARILTTVSFIGTSFGLAYAVHRLRGAFIRPLQALKIVTEK